jgi:hypothetical protein
VAIAGLKPGQAYQLALADSADGSGPLEGLGQFKAGPDGAGMVSSLGPFRASVVVRGALAMKRGYLCTVRS